MRMNFYFNGFTFTKISVGCYPKAFRYKNIFHCYLGCSLIFASCALPVSDQAASMVRYQDAQGRSIQCSTKINRVITMRAGALRLLLYMGLHQQIAYIEKNDLKRQVPYMMAYPELKQLPLIGTGNHYDPEAIAASGADMLISTYMTSAEADALQDKTGKPVFCLQYGDLYHFKHEFYASLQVLGDLFDKKSRADSLISYIENTLRDLKKRTENADSSALSVYIGGIAFNGIQGITSTRAQYPPFIYLNLSSPFDKLPHSLESIGLGQKNSLIDKEQLLEWDTDYVFLDASGRALWEKEWSDPLFSNLKAKKDKNTYTVLPFNWHTINYENLLCNMWFIGKTVYPEQFYDIDLEEKCREIFIQFYQNDIYEQVMNSYRPFESIDLHHEE